MSNTPYYRLLDGAAFASAKASVGEARRWLRKSSTATLVATTR